MDIYPFISTINPVLPVSWQDRLLQFANTFSDEKKTVQELPKEVVSNSIPEFVEKRLTIAVISGPGYVHKIMTLHESLAKYTSDFNLIVCCIDPKTRELFEKLNLMNVIPVDVAKVEGFEPSLKIARAERQLNEYCWTLKAPLCEWVFAKYKVKSVLYLDGDLYFYSSPQHILKEWGQASIYLTKQRDVGWVEDTYGFFQAGMVGFKNDEDGLRGVRWWKQKCLEWCFKRSEEGRFGDQKYLDRIPQVSNNVFISSHEGINAAPWNTIYHHNPEMKVEDGQTLIHDKPLVAFHFACLSITGRNQFDLWDLDTVDIPKKYMRHIYIPYLKRLHVNTMKLIQQFPELKDSLIIEEKKGKERTYFYLSNFAERIQKTDRFYTFTTIVSKTYIIKALAMMESLEETKTPYHLYALTIDPEAEEVLAKFPSPNVTVLPLESIMTKELKKIKKERTTQEFCWTLKGPLIQHVLNTYPEIDKVVYVDADQYFFREPKSIIREWKKYSILLTLQRASEDLEKTHGRFQAGMIGFKREANSLKILDWWTRKCLSKCSNEYDPIFDSWGDQKYIDTIPDIFENIKIMDSETINVGPWNLLIHDGVELTSSDTEKPHINGKPLESYHFGSLSQISQGFYDIWRHDKISLTYPQKKTLYLPYLKVLQEVEYRINKAYGYEKTPDFYDGEKGPVKNSFYYSLNDEV